MILTSQQSDALYDWGLRRDDSEPYVPEAWLNRARADSDTHLGADHPLMFEAHPVTGLPIRQPRAKRRMSHAAAIKLAKKAGATGVTVAPDGSLTMTFGQTNAVMTNGHDETPEQLRRLI